MALATTLCFIALGFVLINVDPFIDTGTGFWFFYVSIFLGILGLSSMISFTIHRFFSKLNLPMFKFVQSSFKDAFLFAIGLTGLLYLQGQGYLKWWSMGLVIVMVILYIVFSLSNNKNLKSKIED